MDLIDVIFDGKWRKMSKIGMYVYYNDFIRAVIDRKMFASIEVPRKLKLAIGIMINIMETNLMISVTDEEYNKKEIYAIGETHIKPVRVTELVTADTNKIISMYNADDQHGECLRKLVDAYAKHKKIDRAIVLKSLVTYDDAEKINI
jgi:hypothetical protein